MEASETRKVRSFGAIGVGKEIAMSDMSHSTTARFQTNVIAWLPCPRKPKVNANITVSLERHSNNAIASACDLEEEQWRDIRISSRGIS